jgi:hypothetical protein
MATGGRGEEEDLAKTEKIQYVSIWGFAKPPAQDCKIVEASSNLVEWLARYKQK